MIIQFGHDGVTFVAEGVDDWTLLNKAYSKLNDECGVVKLDATQRYLDLSFLSVDDMNTDDMDIECKHTFSMEERGVKDRIEVEIRV